MLFCFANCNVLPQLPSPDEMSRHVLGWVRTDKWLYLTWNFDICQPIYPDPIISWPAPGPASPGCGRLQPAPPRSGGDGGRPSAGRVVAPNWNPQPGLDLPGRPPQPPSWGNIPSSRGQQFLAGGSLGTWDPAEGHMVHPGWVERIFWKFGNIWQMTQFRV